MKTYYISTDSGSQEIEAADIGRALLEFGFPKWVETSEDFEEFINESGGYGFITENDIEVARVSS
jgi:hypothetical protein